jgi:hypothetical protein
MTAWNYQPYQGIPSQLLDQLANVPSKNAAGLNALSNSRLFPQLDQTIQKLSDAQRQKQLIQKLSMAMQNASLPQQGPQMLGGQQPPTSGMGAPSGQDSSQILGTLMQMDPSGDLVQKLVAQRMGLNQTPMNPLQLSEITKNEALAKKYSQSPTSGSSQGGWRSIQTKDGSIYMYNENTGERQQVKGPSSPPPPKPVNPVPAAALDVKVQQDNQNSGSILDRLFGFSKPITNPLKPNNGLTPQEQEEYDRLHAKFGDQQ